jgi:hypothetical protein
MDGHGSGVAIPGATTRYDGRRSWRPTLNPSTPGSRHRRFLPTGSIAARHTQQHLAAPASVHRRLVLRHRRLFAHVLRLR